MAKINRISSTVNNILQTLTVNVNTNGIYNNPNNLNPDNIGIVATTRANPPVIAGQTILVTCEQPNSDAILINTVRAMDTNALLHYYDGTDANFNYRRVRGDANGFIYTISVGNVAHDAVDSERPVKIGGRATASQIAAVAANDRTDAMFTIYGEQIIAGYTYTTNSNRSEEINPLSQQVLPESLVDTTNLAILTYEYPSSLGMAMLGYKDFSLTGKLIAAGTSTMTVWATNDEDQAAADWIQIYGYRTDLAPAAAIVNSIAVTAGTVTFGWDFDNLNYRYVKVRLVIDNATNTDIIKARRKAL